MRLQIVEVATMFIRHCPDRDLPLMISTVGCCCSLLAEPETRAPLFSTATSAPLELVCIDFWSAEDSNNKSIESEFKLGGAYPCPNQS